jgi:DNA-binding NarL/FixJ family response regulator
LIADDHPMIRSGLARLVAAESDLEVVGVAGNGLRAVELAEAEQPDVIVLDLSMPDLDGITATERIRRRSPNARVLALSAYVWESVVTSAFTAGAHGYLSKHGPAADVISGIRLTHVGRRVLSDVVRDILDADPPRS